GGGLLVEVVVCSADGLAETAVHRRVLRKRCTAPLTDPITGEQVERTAFAHVGKPAPDGALADPVLLRQEPDLLDRVAASHRTDFTQTSVNSRKALARCPGRRQRG